MSFQVDTALVQSYKANVTIKFQQRVSRLRPYVRVESQNAEFDFYDRIGPTDAQEVLTRHGDTPLISTPHDRRRVALRDFDWADMIDNKDKLRMLIDPTSAYTRNAVSALSRKIDDVIIEAAFGTAYTGKTGSTTVAFGAGVTASSTVATNYVETGTAANSNLTVAKLRRVRYLLEKAEALDEEAMLGGAYDLCIAVDPSQKQALLRDPQVTSADYNNVRALVDGKIDTYMGFKFIMLNRLPVASSIRSCIAWEKEGLLLAVADEINVDVGPRRDKRNSIQVYVKGSFNSTRMWEEKVVKVNCDETV
jgi:hypothetical protein